MDIKGSKSVSFRWNRERFLGVAKESAEEIIRNAVWCGEKAFWFSVTSEGEQTVIKPVDYYFYSGIGGIAVFFRRLCAVYPEYGEVSSTLEQMLFSYADKISNREKEPDTQYTGMYCGEGSKIRSGIWEQRVSDGLCPNEFHYAGSEVYEKDETDRVI